MRANPRVSIVIPVYNGGTFFEQALQSALAQTYRNIEVVVVNDGSTDGGWTESIARRYDQKIKYIQQENKGVAGALNTALGQLGGDIFTWLSHDDLFLPDKIESQVAYYNKLGNKNLIIFSDYYLINENGEVVAEVKLDHEKFVRTPMMPLLTGSINGCTLFIPTHIIKKFGPFDESLRYTQDYDLWNKILVHHEFVHHPQTVIKYRTHSGQDSHKPAAVAEGDALWIRIVETRSPTERVQLFGSSRKYFAAMAEFLDQTPYSRAAEHARRRVAGVLDQTLVSVIIPFFNEIDCVLNAARSVLDQTHSHLELILVDDGSTEEIGAIEDLAREDARIRLVRQPNGGPASARNYGMALARGEYIAFLDADDVFVPQKIRWQLDAMQDSGSLMSHTSYYVSFPERTTKFGTLHSGAFAGNVYPRILASCPIATPTVMLHRSLIGAGFHFPEDSRLCEDILGWIWIAQRHSILGLDQPLTVVEWSTTSAAINLDKSTRGVFGLLLKLKADPLHSHHPGEIAALENSWRALLNYLLTHLDQPYNTGVHEGFVSEILTR
jgi:glycosyltransferase involved in cell wall biosynthesis